MSHRMLLVEDEEHLSFTLSFNLAEEGYQVDVAGTLAAARAALDNSPGYDLIVLDVMLPDGSGFHFARDLRQAGNLVPILMLTAKGTSEDIVSGLDAGADDYLTKPFALSELMSRISAILRRREWERSRPESDEIPEIAEFSFRDNHINFVTQKVVARGKPVRLTDLEMRLLQFFVAHVNKVVSRTELLEAVWELPASASSRTVDNFIVRLRRLFEKDPAEPEHFLAVRGVGYRFVPNPD